MTNNTNVVLNGVKIFNDRTYNDTPTYSIPNRFRVSINTPDVSFTDTLLTTLVPISGTESVDDCYAITGWTAVGIGNSISGDYVTYKPDSGTGGSLTCVKTGTGVTLWSASKATTSLNGTNKTFISWVYVKDSTTLAKLATGTGSAAAMTFIYGSDSANFARKDVLNAELLVGWNFISASITGGFTSVSGVPALAALDYAEVRVNVSTTGDLLTAGEINFDSIRLCSSDDYYKTVDSITIDDTDGSASVVSKLTITEANGFLINGLGLYNTDGTELLFLKSKFTENSKGITDLFKITTKIKMRNINQ